MHISTLIVRNMLSWMLSYIHVHILHKVQTFPHKENTCVFPFGRSHFTHARILHVLPSLQQETWCTFTDSQGSANNIHTHGWKSRYTLEYTQTAFQHSNIALAYSDMYKLIYSPSWLVLLTRADTGTFTHINILRSHSHEYYHTLTCISSVQFSSVAQSCPTLCDPMNRSTPGLPVHHHLLEFTQTHVHRVRYAIQPSHPRSSPSPTAANHRIRNSLTLMRFVYPQWHTHLHMQANSDTMKNIPRYSFAHKQ